ncbi:hypothetical protein H4217_003894 [Coemansia sp. RSA 1939]|nr:hypothetical protein H4217_003894 [Coemansia sp. RSA 1939]
MLGYICIAVVVAAAAVSSAAAKSVFPMPQLTSGCSTTAVRRDITTLAPAELQRFIHVVHEMHRRGWMDGFGSMHDHISHQVHGNDQFFAWHRRFLRHFEVLMQEIDPDVVLPYWNWATYWQNPLADPVLGASYFGGNGRAGDSCVVDGAMARWGRNYPTRSCLTRKYRYGTSTGSFWPMRAVRDVMNTSKSHAQFRSRIENGAHGIVHLGLGGDFETMWAPVDVLFFLHHATIDKVWAEWQSRDQQRFHEVDGFDSARQPVTAKSIMPFYGEEVGTTLLTSGPGYCYVYDDVPSPPAFFKTMRRRGVQPAFYAPPDQAAAAAAPDSDYGAFGRLANVSAPVADFAPPQPMDPSWLRSMNYDLKEAARMQRLVSSVVAQINAERKETPEST